VIPLAARDEIHAAVQDETQFSAAIPSSDAARDETHAAVQAGTPLSGAIQVEPRASRCGVAPAELLAVLVAASGAHRVVQDECPIHHAGVPEGRPSILDAAPASKHHVQQGYHAQGGRPAPLVCRVLVDLCRLAYPGLQAYHAQDGHLAQLAYRDLV
jgi:D-serine deaminase-like pyridoxal phosphate-dependent protein